MKLFAEVEFCQKNSPAGIGVSLRVTSVKAEHVSAR